MADSRPITRGYNMPVAAIYYNFAAAVESDDEPVRRIKKTLDIAHCDVSTTLAALAFTCEPGKEVGTDTPHALWAFVPALKSAPLTAEQTEALQHALIEALPTHLREDIRSIFPLDKEAGKPVDAQERLALWLRVNTTPAKLIEPLLGLPDARERIFDALEHLCLNVSHDSIAEFQRDLKQARSEISWGKRLGVEPDENAMFEFHLFFMNHAVRSQLASLAGITLQYEQLLPLGVNNGFSTNDMQVLFDLHRMASAVMQPLDGLGHSETISAMKQLLVEGGDHASHPSMKQAYVRTRVRYLAGHPGKEVEAAAMFEKAFLYRLVSILPPYSRLGATAVLKTTVPHEKMKDDFFMQVDGYLAVMQRICS